MVFIWPYFDRIVLAAIKVQADHQEIDPENDIQKLDWDRIRQEIHQRIPQKLNGILGGSACHDWFKNRVLAYQRQFPDNKLHKKSVIQQLFQHYSDRKHQVLMKFNIICLSLPAVCCPKLI